jgi:hypothetical protein
MLGRYLPPHPPRFRLGALHQYVVISSRMVVENLLELPTTSERVNRFRRRGG